LNNSNLDLHRQDKDLLDLLVVDGNHQSLVDLLFHLPLCNSDNKAEVVAVM
jgi:hypothetical protein